ncbi:MAG: peptidylprolyl isomerase, partial [Rhodospirillales bacterium]|nr:peptidylprolyl isomerase [Rhodospirillales bacterium]
MIARKVMTCSLASAMVAALAWATPAAAQVDRIAAVVNEDAISVRDLEARTQLTIVSGGMTDSIDVRKRVMPQVLRRLIDEKLQLQEAERLKLAISEADIDTGLGKIEEQNEMKPGSLIAQLRGLGIDATVLRQQVKAEIAWIKVVRRTVVPNVRIGEEEVDARLQAIRAALGKPEDLAAEIFLAVDNPANEDEVRRLAERLLDNLRAGAPFQQLARQFSQNATAASGGDMGWVPSGTLDDELSTALAALAPGQVSVPVRSASGYHLLLLRDRRIAGQNAADTTVSLAQIFQPLPRNAGPAERQALIEKAKDIQRQVKTCDDVERLAKQMGTPQSGKMGRLKLGELPEPLRPIVGALRVGEASKPLSASDGVAVMMVCDRTAGTQGGPSREEIQHRLEDDRTEMLARRHLRDLRRSAFVEIRM